MEKKFDRCGKIMSKRLKNIDFFIKYSQSIFSFLFFHIRYTIIEKNIKISIKIYNII